MKFIVPKEVPPQAKRAHIKEILLCEENKRDIDEIKPEYLKIEFTFTSLISSVNSVFLLSFKQENKINKAKSITIIGDLTGYYLNYNLQNLVFT